MALPASAVPTAALGERLADAVTAAKQARPLAPVTVVTPSGYAAVAMRRHVVLGGRPLVNVDFTTIGRLAQKLAGPVLAAQGRRRAGPAAELEALRLAADDGPEPWPRLAQHPGALAALERACTELQRGTDDTIEWLAGRGGRAGAVAALCRAARDRLHEHGLCDELDLRQAALVAVGGVGATPTGPVVVVEAPGLAPTESALLDALGKRVAVTWVAAATPVALSEVQPCTDPEEEARAAVREVVRGAEAGVPLWRQGVFHPADGGYARVLRHALDDAGLSLAVGGRLDASAPGAVLLGLLELMAGDWPRQDVVAWLSSGPVVTGPGGRAAPSSRWHGLSAEAGVVRGLGQWRDRLGRLADEQPRDATEALALLSFVEDLASMARPADRTWGGRARWAAGLLDRYLDPAVGVAWPEDQVAALAQVRVALADLGALDSLSPAPDDATFRRALRAQLETTVAEHSDAGGVGDGVVVAPFALAPGLELERVVCVGLADALVPGTKGDDGLLPDEVRRLEPGAGLRTRGQVHDELLACLRAAVAAGTERRVATLPLADPRTGRAHAPSRWLSALRGPATVERPVASFAAGLQRAETALSSRELRLAVVDRARRAGAELLDSPPVVADHLLRTGIEAVRARTSRRFTRYDGNVGPGLVSPFDPARPVSATRFEMYPECPRKYLFERVLGISTRPLPEDLWRIEAASRGSLVHAILEQYVVERLQGADASLERLLDIAADQLDRAEAAGITGKPLVWLLERAAVLRDLRTFHAEEAGLQPLAAEFPFGDEEAGAPPVAVGLPDGRVVHFRGRADRVDRDAEGNLVVSDYKTGKQKGLADIRTDPLLGGKRLQLPLYALAARERFGSDRAVMARYWLVSGERSAASYTVELTEELERHFATMVGRIAVGVDDGLFPAIPGEPRDDTFGVCVYCDFDRVCSATRDRQWAAKRGAPELGPVNELLDSQAPDTLLGSVVVDTPRRRR